MSEPKYPKGERVWVGYYNSNHELRFILTSKDSRDFYFLYELVEDGFRKLGKARSPTELEEWMTLLMIAGKRNSWLNRLAIASVAAKVGSVLSRQIT